MKIGRKSFGAGGMLMVAGLAWLGACSVTSQLPTADDLEKFRAKELPATEQVGGGDPDRGLEYVTGGDYVGAGIPWEFFTPEERTRDTLYPRPGDDGLIRPSYNVFELENGVKVASGNCFSCHAQSLLGQYRLGLGAVGDDYAEDKSRQIKVLSVLVKRQFGKESAEWEAYQQYEQFLSAMTPYIVTPFDGPNPAFRLEEGCVRYRDPATLEFRAEPGWEMDRYTLAGDVPPLWNVRKKTVLYWNGMGRGDFSKLMMQASVLGIVDSTAARKVQQQFVDVVAWAKSLEPPKYPGAIDESLALMGKGIFEENCSRCHGTYGEEWTYPNKLVSLPTVGTDPYMALWLSRQSRLSEWYNASWYATTPPYSELVPEEGYVAPPLDGIWATGPYLHNGSVPTVAAVLDSRLRPDYWARKAGLYDLENMGVVYEEKRRKGGRKVYDTAMPGYSNVGHYFGDRLSDEERRGVMEYLKTL